MQLKSDLVVTSALSGQLRSDNLDGMQMSASDRLKLVRESLGKTQKDMAAMLGLSYRTYQNYEDGVNNPGWDACEALTRLGFNANWFLSGEGPMQLAEQSQAANGQGVIQGDGNELHIDIHADHPFRRDADRALDQLLHYGSDPLVTAMLIDFSRLSKSGKLDVLKFMDQVAKGEKEDS